MQSKLLPRTFITTVKDRAVVLTNQTEQIESIDNTYWAVQSCDVSKPAEHPSAGPPDLPRSSVWRHWQTLADRPTPSPSPLRHVDQLQRYSVDQMTAEQCMQKQITLQHQNTQYFTSRCMWPDSLYTVQTNNWLLHFSYCIPQSATKVSKWNTAQKIYYSGWGSGAWRGQRVFETQNCYNLTWRLSHFSHPV